MAKTANLNEKQKKMDAKCYDKVMKQKVYIDSTVPSFYFDDRESISAFTQITKQWWNEERLNYDIWMSVAVLNELGAGSYPRKKDIIGLVKNIPLLEEVEELEEIASFYIEHYVMPQDLMVDAAYASYYNIDYLLTWNCNHLANANKRKHMRVINGRLGLSTPEIVTPLELFSEELNHDY